MLIPLEIIIVVNLAVLLFFLLAIIWLIRLSIRYTRAVGDDTIQYPTRMRILRLLLFLFITSLFTAALNIIAGLS